MNALLLCFGVGWIGLAFAFEAAQIWTILQTASTVQEGWTRVNDVFASYTYPHMLFEPLVFMPGFAAFAWRQHRIANAADRPPDLLASAARTDESKPSTVVGANTAAPAGSI